VKWPRCERETLGSPTEEGVAAQCRTQRYISISNRANGYLKREMPCLAARIAAAKPSPSAASAHGESGIKKAKYQRRHET